MTEISPATAPEWTPAQSAAYSQDYRNGYRAGRSDAMARTSRNLPAAQPEEQRNGYRTGYWRGHAWTTSHAPEWFACVCGQEFRSAFDRSEHAARRGCLLVNTSR